MCFFLNNRSLLGEEEAYGQKEDTVGTEQATLITVGEEEGVESFRSFL